MLKKLQQLSILDDKNHFYIWNESAFMNEVMALKVLCIFFFFFFTA
jgi:hypothetical protein